MTQGDDVLQRTGALLTLGRATEAESVLRAALLHAPHDPDLLRELAGALYAQRRFQEARDAAQRSLAADPESAVGLMQLSAAEAGSGDRPTAIRVSRRAVQLAPLSAEAHRQLGALLLNSGRVKEAFPELRRARQLRPDYVPAATTLALAHLQSRQYAEALTQVTDALRLDPDDAEAHRVAGLLQSASGHARHALVSSREAMRLDPLDPLNRAAYAAVLKSRNPLYRWLVRRAQARSARDRRLNMLRLYVPLMVLGIVSAVWPGAATGVFAGVLVVLFAIWSLDPIMNLVVCLDGHGRLLEPLVRRSALVHAAYLPVVAGCLVWGLASGRSQPLWAAVVAGGWAVAAGHAHHAIREVRVGVWAAHACGAVLVVLVCWLALVDSASFGQDAFLVAAGAYVCWLVEILDWRSISGGYGP